MKKLSLVRKKIVFLIVIAVIFLIAIGVILLLVFIENHKAAPEEKTLQEKIADLLNTKFRDPEKIDREAMEKILTTQNRKSNVEVNQQAILNLLNQKNK